MIPVKLHQFPFLAAQFNSPPPLRPMEAACIDPALLCTCHKPHARQRCCCSVNTSSLCRHSSAGTHCWHAAPAPAEFGWCRVVSGGAGGRQKGVRWVGWEACWQVEGVDWDAAVGLHPSSHPQVTWPPIQAAWLARI